jgi:hypothetical protein
MKRIVDLNEQDIKRIVLRVIEENQFADALTQVGDLAKTSFTKLMDDLKSYAKGETPASDTEKTPTDTSSSETTISSGGGGNFMDITKKVIEKFEGGYWNPICSKYPNTRHPKKEGAYLNSGETMFGLDRVAGSIEKWSSAGRQFFGLIDKEKERLGEEKFCNTWKWNYIPPDPLKSELMNLAAETMKTAYENNVKTFFKGDTKKVVDSSRALLLHFSYATWNGPGFFQRFANTINKGVAEGKSIKSLIELAKQDRLKHISGYWAEGSKRVNAAIDQEAQIDNVS